ncbi:MAG: orotidine 5'-phosphate decarboxylase / HUMPS family protein [Acidilobaceae archaeon]
MVRGRLSDTLRECEAIVQVALDYTDIWSALRTASLMPDSRALILEAGTPLLKSWGYYSIKALRSVKPESVIVADTKTIDAAKVEASIIYEAGADVFTVLALADDETLKSAIESAESMGLSVYGDTIACRDLLACIERLSRLRVDVALIHVGLDVQERLGIRAGELNDIVRRASSIFNGPIAVAGGITPREVESMINSGARIVIIGSAITRSSDPRGEAIKALESLRRAGVKCP